MNPNVDLSQLAGRRDAPAVEPRRSRHLLARYLLPAAVLVGFVGVMAWAARDSLLPAHPVTVVPVLTTRAELRQEAGTPLFQAAGWVEPRPTPILVTALAEGVVEQLLVVEGQAVKAGEPVARLVEADARLALAAAEVEVQLREAELSAAQANLSAAQTSLKQPIHLETVVAEAEAALAKLETELANLPHQTRAAEARTRLARTTLDRRKTVPDLVGGLTIEQAQSDLEAVTAQLEELKYRLPRLEREGTALRQRRDAVKKQLELRVEETRRAAETAANVLAARARLKQAQLAVDTAKLRLDRMTVRSAHTGRVLALVARPGVRLMGLASGSLQESSTVVTLYDPMSLQVRADVRLEDVPRVQPGQQVRIDTPSVPGGGIKAEVLFTTSQANLQKNTLEVKVALKSPHELLRPDMLVQATFLAAASTGHASTETEQLRLLVPRSLVESAEGNTRVWVVDAHTGLARQRGVKLGMANGDLIEVVEGLGPADKLIAGGRESLRDGHRVQVTGEDVALGIVVPAAASKHRGH